LVAFESEPFGEQAGMTKVLIAVNSSETSIAAAESAYRLFGDAAEYVVMNVSSDGPILWGDDSLQYGSIYPMVFPGAGVVGAVPLAVPGADTDDGTSSRVEDSELLASDVAAQAGVPHPQVVGDTGDVADAIIAAAHDRGVDVIVIGAHDRGWLERMFTKSVSSAILREADVPVLVVR
jgi:nucleotide-binding universal stress UspA family protein